MSLLENPWHNSSSEIVPSYEPRKSGSLLRKMDKKLSRALGFLFFNRTTPPSKSIAQSIVYFLEPGSSAHEQFKKLVKLFEQYYHPFGGR
ncbi:unnamed protein product [Arabidopsis halleri]